MNDSTNPSTRPAPQDIQSYELRLAKIVSEELQFSVPIYQRLYVWGAEQIGVLLDDLVAAYLYDKDNSYYLGGIMLSKNKQGTYDVIDGQQRFTTLWLLARVIKGGLNSFLYKGTQPRLNFAVREFANQYLRYAASVEKMTEKEQKELQPMREAEQFIKNYLKDLKDPKKQKAEDFDE